MKQVNLVIIGGGPAGMSAAIAAIADEYERGEKGYDMAVRSQTARILLAATGLCHNGGAKFTYEGKFVHCRGADWGKGKTVNEGIPATITLPSKAAATKCWALDERGERKEPVPVSADSSGNAVVKIGPAFRTVWYEIAVGPSL